MSASNVVHQVGSTDLPIPSTVTGMNVNESYAALKNPSPVQLSSTIATQMPSGASGTVRITNPAGNDLVAVGGLPGSGDDPYFLAGQVGIARGTVIMPGEYYDFPVTDSGLLWTIAQRDGDIITIQSLLSQTDYQTPTTDPSPNPLSIEPFAILSTANIANGATQWPIDGVITLLLNKTPDPTTVNTTNIEVTPAVPQLTVYVDPSNPNQIVINPNGSNFAYNTTYTVTIPNTLPCLEVLDTGEALVGQYTLSFTTFVPATPTVVSVTPGTNATSIPVNSNVIIVMSIEVKPGDVTTANVQLKKQSDNSVVTQAAGSPSLANDSKTITLTPAANLGYSTAYYVVVQNLKNVASIVMSPSPWNGSTEGGGAGLFTTFSPATATVNSVTPGLNAANVSINTTVSIVMNVPVLPADVTTANVQLIKQSDLSVVTQAGGSPSLGADGMTITLTPSAALLYSTVYYVKVQNLRNIAGVIMSPSPWDGAAVGPNNGLFTTTSVGASPAPTVATCTPGGNASAVAINVHPVIVMNTTIVPGNVTGPNVALLRASDNALIPSTVAIAGDNKTITITPTSNLANSTTYYIQIQNQVANTNPFLAQSPNPWYGDSRGGNIGLFTTILTAPNVSTVTPGNNATNVAITTAVTTVMTVPVKSADVTSTNVQLIKNSDSSVVAQATGSPVLAADNVTITLNPAANLANNTAYYMKVQNLHNTDNAIQSPNPWNGATQGPNKGLFTTIPPAPTVSTVTPGSNATGVAVNTAITIVMSIQINSAPVIPANVSLIKQSDSSVVTCTVSFNTTNKTTITLTPTAPLVNNTTYYVVVQNQTGFVGAVPQSPSPWYGDSRQGNNGLFTTVATPPTVVSVTPGNNQGGVAINTTSVVVMDQPVVAADVTTAGNVTLVRAADIFTIPSTVALGADTKTITLTPSASLDYNTTYYTKVQNIHSTGGLMQTPNPYNPYVASGGFISVYNVAQDSNTHSPSCGSGGNNPGAGYYCYIDNVVSGTDWMGVGEIANASNGLIGKVITQVILASVKLQSSGSGNVGIKIIRADGTIVYTFSSAQTITSTSGVSVTLSDTNNTYPMQSGDMICVTWNRSSPWLAVGDSASAGYGGGARLVNNVIVTDSGYDLAAQLFISQPASGANAFTTVAPAYTQRYNVSQSSNPCSSSVGFGPATQGICQEGCGPGRGMLGTGQYNIGVAYGETASVSNNLTAAPITKVVIPSVIACTVIGGGSLDPNTNPSGTIGIQIVSSSGTVRHTFVSTFSTTATGYVPICTMSCNCASGVVFNGYTNITLIDNTNTYTMVVGDILLITWTGNSSSDTIAISQNTSGPYGAAKYKTSGGTLTAISGMDVAMTLYSSP